MTSRLIPPHLTATVAAGMEAERELLRATPRGVGRDGEKHDRTAAYLDLMLESTGRDESEGMTVEEGHLVSLRFDRDAEHRTYLLSESPGSEGILRLPPGWPLAAAVLGLRPGQTATYQHEGREHTVHVIAVWEAGTSVRTLPENAEAHPAQASAPKDTRRTVDRGTKEPR